MSVLLPWLLAAGAAAIAGIGALHLLSRDEPPRWLLPTARFVPRSRERAPARSLAPSDRTLLALRLLALAAIALAAARPSWQGRRMARAQVIVADVGRTTADRLEVAQAVRAAWQEGDRVIVLDSVARGVSLAGLDSLVAGTGARAPGRLSAALLVARDEARALARVADSVALVVVSPLVADGIDAATFAVRATWPGGIRVVRTAAVAAPPGGGHLAVTLRAGAADPLRATLALGGWSGGTGSRSSDVRLVRTPSLSVGDSAAARAGATVVHWPDASTSGEVVGGVATAGAVFVAMLSRATPPAGGRAVARWVDGTSAATEHALGAGCVRSVAIPLAAAGDAVLRERFRAVVRDLLAPCGGARDLRALDAAEVRAIEGPATAAARAALVTPGADAPLVRWLLALAALALGGEWWWRRRQERA